MAGASFISATRHSHRPLVFSVIWWLLVFISRADSRSTARKQPHVVFILADDLGFNDVGYQNVDEQPRVIETPHLDALAAQGVKLSNYYVQSICSPTRSVLLTGKYQIRTGLQHSIIQSGQPNALGREHTIIPEKLKTLGYTTHMVGKWHLGYYRSEFTPPQRGFDSYFGYWNGAEQYWSHAGRCEFPGWECDGPTACHGVDMNEGNEPYESTTREYSTDLFTRRAIDIIENHDPSSSSSPLFLYLAYQAVHGPLEAPEYVLKERFSHVKDPYRRVYAGMLWKLDEGVGNVTAALKEAGLWEDTVLIFSTDNGGDINFGANNWPLRGWKASSWEGGIHGVGFVASPLLEERGVTRHGLIHVADWFPTIMRLAGGTLEEGEAVDGVDQWDMISRGAESTRSEILHIIDPIGLEEDPIGGTKHAALRVGDYKLLVGAPGQWWGHDGWIPPPGHEPSEQQQHHHHVNGRTASHDNYNTSWDWTDPHCQPCVFRPENLTTGICVFNIERDPLEKCNLAPARPDLVSTLLHRLEEYNATAVPARFPPPSQLCDPALYGNRFVSWGDDDVMANTKGRGGGGHLRESMVQTS